MDTLSASQTLHSTASPLADLAKALGGWAQHQLAVELPRGCRLPPSGRCLLGLGAHVESTSGNASHQVGGGVADGRSCKSPLTKVFAISSGIRRFASMLTAANPGVRSVCWSFMTAAYPVTYTALMWRAL